LLFNSFWNILLCNQKRRGTRTNPRHRTHTGTRPTPLATTTAFFLGQSPSATLLVLLQYNTTLPKHTSYSSETANLPRQCAIQLMTLRPDLSSCSYTTRWQDRHQHWTLKTTVRSLFHAEYSDSTSIHATGIILICTAIPRFKSSRPSVADRSGREKQCRPT